ncbi:hypothetical protein WJX81_001065 [Elliptochloris bilobata]|uniref:Uncharacterized protein n=1 Tax=Elliptochloris bilobata TaxID=381761 RepID=A0AAW1SIS4_9CHLO
MQEQQSKIKDMNQLLTDAESRLAGAMELTKVRQEHDMLLEQERKQAQEALDKAEAEASKSHGAAEAECNMEAAKAVVQAARNAVVAKERKASNLEALVEELKEKVEQNARLWGNVSVSLQAAKANALAGGLGGMAAGRKMHSRAPPAASQPTPRVAAQKKSRFASMSATTLAESGGGCGYGVGLTAGMDDDHTSPPKDDSGGGGGAVPSAPHRQPKEPKAEGRRRNKAAARAGAAAGQAPWSMPSAAADIFGTASVDPYTF